MVQDAGLENQFEIESAGTISSHQGNPPDPRMTAHLEKRGYKSEGKARYLQAADLKYFDILLTMDEENLTDTLRHDPEMRYRAKVKPFVEFMAEKKTKRIPDPYYGGDAGFAHVIDLLEDGCAGLLKKLSGTDPLENARS